MYKFVLKVSWNEKISSYSDQTTTYYRIVSLTAPTEVEALLKAKDVFYRDGMINFRVVLENTDIKEVSCCEKSTKYTADKLLEHLEAYSGIYDHNNDSNG